MAWVLAAACVLLGACASPALRDADELSLQGHNEQALAVLDAARVRDPADHALQAAQQRQRELTISVLANQAASARAGGRTDIAKDLLARLETIAPTHPRTVGLREELRRDASHEQLLAEARLSTRAASSKRRPSCATCWSNRPDCPPHARCSSASRNTVRAPRRPAPRAWARTST